MKKKMVRFGWVVGLLFALVPLAADEPPAEWNDPNSLPIWLTPEEKLRLDEIGIRHRSTAAPTGQLRNPAEWEPSEGVIVRWPLGISVAIIAEMSEDVVVTTIVGSSSQRQSAINSYTSGGVNMANTEFIIAPTNSYWTRDYGPWFIFEDDALAIVDHIYNRPRPDDDVIPQVIGAEWGIDVYGLSLNHTGGNHMSDGLGMSASTELVYDENWSQTQTQIHDKMRDYLGNEYTVLDYIESGGIHHIDCWAKYLNPTTVMVKEVAAGHPSHDLLDARADWLAQQISPWGEPYTVVRVYCPTGTAYTNSLILNDKVLVPIFNSSWDSVALQTYADAMPGYEIIGFTGSWLDDDAIHCRTMGVPDRGMLFIDHIPFKNDDITGGDYTIEAEIVAHSGMALRADQLKVFYSVDGGDWDHVLMTPTETLDVYAGDIPAQSEDSEVRYYISAADDSGRQETHPYVGRFDPHTFTASCSNYPTVDVTPNGPLTACSGEELTLQAWASDATGPFSYQWTEDGEVLPGATDSSLVVSAAGPHTYNCRVWGDGCVTPRTDPEDVEALWQSRPFFDGLTSVSSPPEATCTLDLAWEEAEPACEGPIYYDIHRSITPGFWPRASNRLVAGHGGTAYRDAHDLESGSTYYYIVRARDDSNGAPDANRVERHGAPAAGCLSAPGCTMTVNVRPNGPTAVCNGHVIPFEATVQGGTAPFSYQWTQDGVPIPGATDSTLDVSFASAQTHVYNCIVGDSGSCAPADDGYDAAGQWAACAGVVTVADGTEGGTTPLRVGRDGDDPIVYWDAATPGCSSEDYHLLWGWGAAVAAYTVEGSDCSLTPSGIHVWQGSPDAAGDWVWFLVVGRDSTAAEGGWGRDWQGVPRTTQASGECATSFLDPGSCLP